MMSIQVPFILPRIQLPDPPSNPPTDQDIAAAVDLLARVKEHYRPSLFVTRMTQDNGATDSDLAKAQLYLHKLCNAAAAGPGEQVERHTTLDLEPIQTRFDQINETLDRIEQKVDSALKDSGLDETVEHHAIQWYLEPIHASFNRMNETMDQMLEIFRLDRLEHRVDSDPVERRPQHTEQGSELQASGLRFGHAEGLLNGFPREPYRCSSCDTEYFNLSPTDPESI